MANTAVFWLLNSVLIGIVGANAEGSTQRLLATHAVHIWSFLLAKFLYCFALEADDVIEARARQQNLENYNHFWGFVALVCGALSSVSLVSTLVPCFTGYIILGMGIAWICAAIIIVRYQYGRLFVPGCRWLHNEILKPFFINIWNWIKGNDTSTVTTERTGHPPKLS